MNTKYFRQREYSGGGCAKISFLFFWKSLKNSIKYENNSNTCKLQKNIWGLSLNVAPPSSSRPYTESIHIFKLKKISVSAVFS